MAFIFLIFLITLLNLVNNAKIKNDGALKEYSYENNDESLYDKETNEIEMFEPGNDIRLVNINGVVYHTFLGGSDIVDTPKKLQISGTIKKLTLDVVPDEHEETNFPECLNQQYAYVDGNLILQIKYYHPTKGITENWFIMHTAGE